MIKTPIIPSSFDLKAYFIEQGLTDLVNSEVEVVKGTNLNLTDVSYAPELDDLYRLHRFIIENKRTTVLEFGVGFSTMVFAHALMINKNKYSEEIKKLRRNNPFELFVVDNEEKFIESTKEKLPKSISTKVNFNLAEVEMSLFNGRVCTMYSNLPLMSPDFIYLDAPDQFNVKSTVNGFSTAHPDLMPMAADILRIEHFLTPGTIIVVDGRAANSRFLKTNLQRNWDYVYEEEYDQHVFHLNEEPLGRINKAQLEFYAM